MGFKYKEQTMEQLSPRELLAVLNERTRRLNERHELCCNHPTQELVDDVASIRESLDKYENAMDLKEDE